MGTGFWGVPMSEGLPVPVSVVRVKQETPSVRTFFFDTSFPFSPGQFVMVWVPGTDEIPMALSSENSITVQQVGDATAALFGIGKGGKLGIRGPFGGPVLQTVVDGGRTDRSIAGYGQHGDGQRQRVRAARARHHQRLTDAEVLAEPGPQGRRHRRGGRPIRH